MRISYHVGNTVVALAICAAIPRQGSAQAMDDWQVHLANGSYVYELHLKSLRRSEVLFEHGGKPLSIPLRQIDEMRRIHKSFKHGTGGARATFGGLAGADDDVVQLSQYSVSEKHDILVRVLALIHDQASATAGETERRRE